jgi:hypothetical protein
MGFDYKPGAIYDTAFYIVARLFEEAIVERVYGRRTQEPEVVEHNMRFYNLLKERTPEVSTLLAPFCYCNSQQAPFLLQYVADHINFDNGTPSNFKALFEDVEKSRAYFIEVYFPKLNERERERLLPLDDINYLNSVIVDSDIEDKYQSTLLAFLLNYESNSQLLLNTITQQYACVLEFHQENAPFIESLKAQVRSKENGTKEKLVRYFGLTEQKRGAYTFSLLNPYEVHYDEKSNRHAFRLGDKFSEILNYESEYNHITYASFAKVLSSPAKSLIFNMFLEYKHLKPGDIIDATRLSTQTVYTHLDSMLAERLLTFADKEGKKYILTLNETYFNKFNQYSRRVIEGYAKGKEKGTLLTYVRPRKKREDAPK